MNTDVRRQIFVAIMGASDCVDAYDRLLKLNLKEKQEREIVRVLLHCCGQEQKFNLYYVLLAQKLCEMDHRFQFTFQLAFWDVLKQVNTFKPRKVYNLATLLSRMIQTNQNLSLSVLKILDFTNLNSQKYLLLFLQVVFENILKMKNEQSFYQVFERLVQSKKPTFILDGIAVFLYQHMQQQSSSSSSSSSSSNEEKQLLKKRLRMLQSFLDQLTKKKTSY
jgi:nucleolar MIF4G domain-containing protein 1